LPKILVIGAANVDIIGVANNPVLANDSNPGSIELSVGGVAKNIAENLKRLELDVHLLSFLGDDSFSEMIRADLAKLNLDYSLSLQTHHRSPQFLSIHNHTGELVLAIHDNRLLDTLQPSDFEAFIPSIEDFEVLVFDTNLPEPVLTYLIQKFQHKKLIVDGVSMAKVGKIKSVLNCISLLKVNQHELSALLGKPADDIILAVKELLKSGLKQIVVTNGANPITYNIDKSIYQTFIFEAKKPISALGCGDALLSGVIYGIVMHKTMHEAINYGKKAASMTMEVAQACHPGLNPRSVEE